MQARSSLLIDSNLLVLLIVGGIDARQVEKHRRTRAYTQEDFQLLYEFANEFQHLVVTPNILTEVSNLAGFSTDPLHRRVFASLANTILQADERYFESRSLVEEPYFFKLGLTDTSILRLAQEGLVILTDDLPLYSRLSSLGAEVVNFNHVRSGAWGISD